MHQSKIRQQQSSLWEHIKRELQAEYRLGEWKELECKSLRRVVLATARVNQKETVELALAQKIISFEVH